MSRYRTGPILIAAGISAAVVVALVALGAWLLSDDDDGGSTPATAEASETPGASETASPSETGSASPAPGSATPSPSASATTAPGVEAIEWSVVEPAAPEQDSVVYVEKGCYQCDGPTTAIERTTSIGNPGAVVVETKTLFEAPGDANRYISSFWMSSRGTDMWVMVCSRGYCGGVGQISDDAQETLYHSDDGGISWSEIETFDGSVGVAFVSDGIPVLARTEETASGQFETTFFTLQGGVEVEGPDGATPLFGASVDELYWISEDGMSLMLTDGTEVFGADRPFAVDGPPYPGGDVILIRWQNANPADPVTYALVENGEVVAEFSGTGATGQPLNVTVGAWIDERTALGNANLLPADVPGLVLQGGFLMPVSIDLATGALAPLAIYGPEFGQAYAGRNHIPALDNGPTGIETPNLVDTGGECLNMREGPASASPVVRCWADGVVLWAPGKEPTEADGVSWAAVEGPDGSTGWASLEFLKR